MRRNRGVPDRDFALAHYRQVAANYDASTRRVERKRLLTLEWLALRAGETVVDVACGTGPMLAALAQRVGAQGRVIGIEQSPEMIVQARARVAAARLENVTLIEAPIEEARIAGPVDALLFCYTHDVLRSRKALRNLFAAARPGARIAACGAKLYPAWLAFLNPWVRRRTYGYLSTVEGLDAPWSHLAEYCPDFRVRKTYFLGSGYIGTGTYAPRAA